MMKRFITSIFLVINVLSVISQGRQHIETVYGLPAFSDEYFAPDIALSESPDYSSNSNKYSEKIENNNLDLSVTAIKDVDNSENNNAALKKQVELFVKAVGKNYNEVLPYISLSYIKSLSVTDFYDIFNTISEEAREKATVCFNDNRPIDGVRIAIADAICSRFNEYLFTISSMEEIMAKQPVSSVSVMLAYGGKSIPTEWALEKGDWRIKELVALKINDSSKSRIDTDIRNLLQLGVNVPANSDFQDMQYMLSYQRSVLTYFTYGIRLGVGRMTDLERDGDPVNAGVPEIFDKTYFFSDFELGAQLPVKVSSVYLIPNVKGIIGLNYGDVTNGLNCGFSVGAQVAYKVSGKLYLIGGLDFRRKFSLSQGYDYPGNDYKFPPYNTFGIHLGIAW